MSVLYRALALFVVISVALNLVPKCVRADDPGDFSFRQQDKQLHMLASFSIAFTMTELMRAQKISRLESVLYASIITMTLGAGKELIIDQRYSRGDMYANMIGVGASAAVVFTFGL